MGTATPSTRTSVCPLDCPDACSLDVRVAGDRVESLDGNRVNPLTGGFICGKVRDYPRLVHGAYRVIDGSEERDDRWIVIACLTDEQWQRAAGVLGHPEWAQDARFATLADRKANEEALDALIGDWAAQQDGEAALEALQAAEVPAGLVLRASEVLADPHLAARAYYVYPDHAEAGPRAYDGAGFLLSKTPNEVRGSAPLLGEHTFEVATEVLGMDPDEVAQLIVGEVLH